MDRHPGDSAKAGATTENEALLPAWVWLIVWLFSRGLMYWVWRARCQHISHDVYYYFDQLNTLPASDALVEYPAPVVWFFQLIKLFSANNAQLFVGVFVLTMFALDALMTVALYRRARLAALFWAVFIFNVGSLIWFRMDLIPTVAVTLALVWLARRPFASGAAIAVGAATKLWPALLVVPLLGRNRKVRQRGFGFVVVGGMLGLASLLFMGWNRSVSPMTWQSDRGLQIESIAATWPMIQHSTEGGGGYRLWLSNYNAWEIVGPSVMGWMRFSDLLMVLVFLLTAVIGWLVVLGGVGLPGHTRAQADDPRSADVRSQAMITAVVAIVCAMMVANKTFSPQYMIWLSGPLAMLVSMRQPRPDLRHSMCLGLLGLGVAALTQQIFPLNYGALLTHPGDPATTALLVIRNLTMVLLAAWSSVRAIQLGLRVGRRGA